MKQLSDTHSGKPSSRKQYELVKRVMEEHGLNSLTAPYEGGLNPDTNQYEVEPEYYGLSNGEVIWLKMAKMAASGSLDHAKYLLDRTLGKPTQSVETTNVNVSYADFLAKLAEEDALTISVVEELEL